MKAYLKHNKYNAKRTMIDGITFDSKAEASRYNELKLLVKAKEARYFHRQPIFDIGAGVKYKADFMIIWNDGTITYEDVKGVLTKEFVMKKKLVEDKYPINIKIVKVTKNKTNLIIEARHG